MLACHGLEVGRSLSQWAADDRLLVAAEAQPVSVPAQDGAADREFAFLPSLGAARLAYHLGIPRSTAGRVLTRYRMLLAHLDQATRLPVRGPPTCPLRGQQAR